MTRNRKIKVLIVDDSLFFREVLSRGISIDPKLEVVATASDPFDARDKILKYEPDVMTCDVEMPRMNGIEFIKKLIPQYPLPVIVVSTVSDAVFSAMSVGAVDFVTKPNVKDLKSVEDFINRLIDKIKIAADAKVLNHSSNILEDDIQSINKSKINLIAIGASTGGTEAIFSILRHLPNNTPGVAIVQHIPPVFSRMFAERLNNSTSLKVQEARTGDYIEPGKVLIAPGNEHMRVKKVGDLLKVECFTGEKVNGHCPSIDILFESVSKTVGRDSLGIILTGMGYDGAKGLLTMRRKGARTIGQDEASSVVYGMPKAAYNIGAVERQVPLHRIPQAIYDFIK